MDSLWCLLPASEERMSIEGYRITELVGNKQLTASNKRFKLKFTSCLPVVRRGSLLLAYEIPPDC